MQRLGLIVVSGLVAAATQGAAATYGFTPAPTNFEVSGVLNIAAPGDGGYGKCKAVWRGKIRPSGQEAVFTSIKITGSKPVCQINTGAANFTFTPSAPQFIESQSVFWTLDGPKQGQCQGVIHGSISSTGVWSISSVLGACSVSGALQSNPPVTIEAK